MPKYDSIETDVTRQFQPKTSANQELRTFRNLVSSLKKDPGQLRAITVKAGITELDGKLKNEYK
jgi:hypothetical protein